MTADTTSRPDTPLGPRPRGTHAGWLALLLPAVVLVAFRLHAFRSPLETDECNYIYIGSRLLAGDALYVDVWDHQPPGVFALFAGVVGVFGQSEFAIRVFATACALACMVLVYACCRKGLGHRTAWLGALLFAICSSDPGMAGEGCNRELYMNLLVLIAMKPLLIGAEVRGPSGQHVAFPAVRAFQAGFWLGLASVVKTVVAVQWLALLLGICVVERLVEKRSLRQLAGLALAFALGPALIWLALALYFALTGRFGLFVDAVFGFNVGYSGLESGLFGRFGAFFDRWVVFRSALPLWIGGLIGLVALIIRFGRARPRWAVMVVALTIGSYAAVCLPGRFWPHYYLLMLPALIMLAVTAYDLLAGAKAGRRSGPAPTRVRATAFAGLLIACLVVTQGLYYLLVPADFIGSPRYGPRMVWARDQGRRVASVTDPGDRVYVWGTADAGIYYYSGRKCASRYTMITGLLGDDEVSQDWQARLIEDLARNKPRLILIAAKPFPALERFLIDHKYVNAGRDATGMQVLCDITRPVDSIDWNWSHPEWL